MSTRTRTMPSSRRTRITAHAILAAAIGAMSYLPATPALAATHTWTNTSGDTNWATINNWNPTGAPQSGDTALITGGPALPQGATWTVNYNVASGPILNSLTLSHTNSKLNFASNVLNVGNATFFPALSTAIEIIGDGSTGAKGFGTLNLAGGFNIVSSNLTLGNLTSDNGFYNLSGSSILQAPRENVAEGGFGTFTQSNGTNALTSPSGNPELAVGDLAGSTGTYNLQGGSLLNHSGFEIIGNFGNGTFTQTGGINAPDSGSNITSLVTVGFLAGSNGTYNMQGGTLTADGLNLAGQGATANFNHSAGNVNLTSTTLAPDLYLGYNTGGIATYTLSNTANLTISNGQELIGHSGGSVGTFIQTGGTNTLNASGGFFSFLYLGVTATANGSYSLSNGSLTLFGGEEYVGYSGVGAFTQTGGAHTLNSSNGSLPKFYVGYNAGSNGNYSLSNGSLLSSGNEYIGNSGNGTFTQTGGTNTLSGLTHLSIAALPGSIGNYSLTGGTLSAPNIYIGGDLSTPGGTGTLTFDSGATLNVSGAISLLPNGTLTGDGVTSAAVVNNGGTISPGGNTSTLTLGSLIANSGSRLSLQPSDLLAVSGNVNLAGPSTIILNGTFTTPVPLLSYSTLTGSPTSLAIAGGTIGHSYTAVNDAANHTLTFSTSSFARYSQISVAGDPAPGGHTFATGLSPGSVNNAGQIAFSSDLDISSVGVYRLDPTGYVTIALSNQTAPGAGGGIISGFINSADNLNVSGQMAFRATLANTIDGSTDGIFRGDGNSLVSIVRNQQVLPSGGGTVTSFGFTTTPTYLNDAGQIPIILHLANASDNAASGVFRADGNSIIAIARNHQAAPGPGGGTFDVTFGQQATFDVDPIMNSSGQVGFMAMIAGSTNGSNVGYFRGDGTTLTAIARNGQLAPGAGGGAFSLQDSYAFNDAGQLAFASFLTGIPGGIQSGVFRGDGNSIIVLARQNLSAPGPGGGVFGSNFRLGNMNAAGQAAFTASLASTTDGSGNGLFRSDGASLIAIARDNQLAPGAGRATFSLDTSASTPYVLPGGQVAFKTFLANTPDGSDEQAIYIGDGQDLIPVAISGQYIASSQFTGAIGDEVVLGVPNAFGQVPWSMLFRDNFLTANFLFTPTLHWRSNSSGNWDTTTNWTLGLAPARVHDVFIDPASPLTITGPATNTTIQSLTIGTGGATATLHLAAGNLKIAGPLTLAGSTNNWTGLLDLAGAKLSVEATPATKSTALSTLQNQVAYAKTHAAGITSSTLPANRGIAVFDNALTNFATFGGLPVDTNSLLVAPELLGDANIDGHVDLTDLSTVLNNFGVATANWTRGNFDGAPTIDLTDLSDVLNNFGLSIGNPSISPDTATPTPEPASAGTLGIIAIAVLVRRHRIPRVS